MRFLFTLGNLTATVEASRQQLLECEGRTGTLLQLYERYQRAGGATAHAQGDDDVLVKLVRVLANMCIHPAVGPALAASEACVELLLETLGERRPSRLLHARSAPSHDLECLRLYRLHAVHLLPLSFVFRTICLLAPPLSSIQHILLRFDLKSLTGTLRCRMFCHSAPSVC